MKYIKRYIKRYKSYWLIPTDYRIVDSLYKIINDKLIIDKFLSVNDLRKNKYVFIIYDYDNETFFKNDNRYWYWGKYDGSLNPEWKKINYKFKGMINLESDEIDLIYAEDSANKYGL